MSWRIGLRLVHLYLTCVYLTNDKVLLVCKQIYFVAIFVLSLIPILHNSCNSYLFEMEWLNTPKVLAKSPIQSKIVS